ncbi:MAG: hypothetical protein J4G05_05480 [Chlorobi bacterium]|nr:hypothetical protein [Chlorobiota bacterium]
MRYFINNQRLLEETFEVDGSISVDEDQPTHSISVRYLPGSWNLISLTVGDTDQRANLTARLFDERGRKIDLIYEGYVNRTRTLIDLAPFNLSSGQHLLLIADENGNRFSVPIIFVQ